jgi:hypothetical protein
MVKNNALNKQQQKNVSKSRGFRELNKRGALFVIIVSALEEHQSKAFINCDNMQ